MSSALAITIFVLYLVSGFTILYLYIRYKRSYPVLVFLLLFFIMGAVAIVGLVGYLEGKTPGVSPGSAPVHEPVPARRAPSSDGEQGSLDSSSPPVTSERKQVQVNSGEEEGIEGQNDQDLRAAGVRERAPPPSSSPKEQQTELTREAVVLRGQIVNARNLRGVEGADVSIGDEGVASDSQGRFLFEVVASGTHLKISAAGYHDHRLLITPRDTGNAIGTIFLRPKLRFIFPRFQAEDDSETQNGFAVRLPELVKSPFVACRDDLEVLVYQDFPKVVAEIERVQKLRGLMDKDELLQIGRMLSASHLVSGSVAGSGPFGARMQLIEIETGRIDSVGELSFRDRTEATQIAQATGEKIIAGMATALITSHVDGEKVATRKITLEGISSCIPASYRMWIAVHPLETDRIYPQDEIHLVTGEWQVSPVYLGSDTTSPGENYTLSVVLVDEPAHQAFDQYMRMCEATLEYPGLRLPRGARITHQLTLTR